MISSHSNFFLGFLPGLTTKLVNLISGSSNTRDILFLPRYGIRRRYFYTGAGTRQCIKQPQDEIIQSGKWRGYTLKESRKIEELVKKADEERLRKLREKFETLK
jgi:hypothetical protein